MLLYDLVRQDLQDKIRRLEEDRHNIDITSGNYDHLSYLPVVAVAILYVILLSVQ